MEQSNLDSPRHNVVDSNFAPSSSTIIVMCHGKKFVIQVKAEDLKGTTFLPQYHEMVESLQTDGDDDDEYDRMCDWMIHPCFAIFRSEAPPPANNSTLTLHDFYFPPTLRLKLSVVNGDLTARLVRGRSFKNEGSLMAKSDQIPSFPDVPRIKASTIAIVVDDRADNYWCEIPRKVCIPDGRECLFKPAFDKSQYIREIKTLTQITHAGLDLRTSKLVGIVMSDNEKMTIGLLVEWIPSLWDLQDSKAKDNVAYHAKWRNEIICTVKELHKRGITWGDVHPGNILIDAAMDAWVVDFGGGWVEPFVTRKTCGTIDGDLLGVANVFEHLKDSA